MMVLSYNDDSLVARIEQDGEELFILRWGRPDSPIYTVETYPAIYLAMIRLGVVVAADRLGGFPGYDVDGFTSSAVDFLDHELTYE